MHATHLSVTAAICAMIVLSVMEHIDQVAVLIMRPHAMPGPQLPFAIVYTRLLQRIIKLRPRRRVEQVGILVGRRGSPDHSRALRHQRTRINQENRAIVNNDVRPFRDEVVPREFGHHNLARTAGQAESDGRDRTWRSKCYRPAATRNTTDRNRKTPSCQARCAEPGFNASPSGPRIAPAQSN